MSLPAVTVVIPSYNRGQLIKPTIQSALDQKAVDVEVLVCDDGSSDDSEVAVRDLDDSRVIWLPGPRTGAPAAPRNRGIAHASGEWVALLDHDDVWHQDKLALQLRELAHTGASACSTNANRCRPGEPQPGGTLYERVPKEIQLRELLKHNLLVTSSLLIATVMARRAGGFPEIPVRRIFADYAFGLRLAQFEPIRGLDLPLVDYRDEISTSLRGDLALELRCVKNTFRDFIAWRREQHPPMHTTLTEHVVMTRHMAGLVSVREMIARADRHVRKPVSARE